ncbi:MAG TPA: flagellin [Spirochaetota bacterium]|jgi:flagellin|nr:flagellin [Spirochaetota bacterium]HPB81109.1 flagellin [Spirochaetota bacterium]HPJ37380.1 flagellin [Spirochaetota bacterium]HPQ52718.1 flagellin [Spirochaetota bacterium]HQO01501.1 flagellin [Spirochaetota bacterium]
MIINHNVSAIFAHRTLKFHDWSMTRDIEKLSSGLRINRAGDDASGLAVSEKMRSQIQGLRQAERNTEDGMSLIQTAEGYLQESHDILQRIRVLAVQSANGIYTPEDRQQIQVEISELVDEIDRISSQAEFNKMKLLTGSFARLNPTASMWFHMGPNMHQRERVFIETMTSAALGLRNPTVLTFISLSTPSKANAVIGLADEALRVISKQRADLGAYYNRLEHAAKGLLNAYENVQASESRIRDTDMAEQMSSFTRYQILTQAATAMLAQANMKSQGVLQLLK